MKIKVCGIRTRSNLNFLCASDVDMIGFIFYDKSRRFFDAGELSAKDLESVNKAKVGVFVNAERDYVMEKKEIYGISHVQLHGDETPQYCESLKETGLKVIKAFGLKDGLPSNLSDFHHGSDCFLFDTESENYGGTGRQFDWNILDNYDQKTPFLLSGGIGPDDAQSVMEFEHKQFLGVDVNSRFEIAPGVKNEALLNEFILHIKNEKKWKQV